MRTEKPVTQLPIYREGKKRRRGLKMKDLKRVIKQILIVIQGYVTPSYYKLYDKLFRLLNLKEV